MIESQLSKQRTSRENTYPAIAAQRVVQLYNLENQAHYGWEQNVPIASHLNGRLWITADGEVRRVHLRGIEKTELGQRTIHFDFVNTMDGKRENSAIQLAIDHHADIAHGTLFYENSNRVATDLATYLNLWFQKGQHQITLKQMR